MGCRAIRLAALSAIFALTAWASVSAQQNLQAGKTPHEMFSNTCTACHSSPRGILKSVSPGQLPGFLRQHYTTGSEMAGALAGYLMASGATQRVEPPPEKKSAKGKRAPEDGAKSKQAPSETAEGGKRPPADVPSAAAAEGAPPPTSKKQVSTKKKGGKRDTETAAPAAPPPAAAPEPAPVAAPEPKPAEIKPAEPVPAAVAAPTPPPPAEIQVDSEGLPPLPELPPLAPELTAPPMPSTPMPPPSPPM